MDEELEQQLIEEYPDLYEDDFVFECEDGWYDLIEAVSSTLDKNCSSTTVNQIKEKHGQLRIYTGTPRDESKPFDEGAIANGITELAREMSTNICERCGSTDDVEGVQRGNRYMVRCRDCREEQGLQ